MGGANAIGQSSCVSFKSSASTFSIVSNKKAAPILLSADEWPGVQRAATDFATDIQRVTGVKPTLSNVTTSSPTAAIKSNLPIIVGTLGRSSLIGQVVNNTKLDVSSIEGKWEAFIAKEVANPLPGVKSAYVIVGADKRGTIFALYDHSEQFGETCFFPHAYYKSQHWVQVSPRGIGGPMFQRRHMTSSSLLLLDAHMVHLL